ncbi:MAG: hypothetical protein ACYT04_73435 [Nostoc sp.]
MRAIHYNAQMLAVAGLLVVSDRIIELPNRYETVAPSGITTLCDS